MRGERSRIMANTKNTEKETVVKETKTTKSTKKVTEKKPAAKKATKKDNAEKKVATIQQFTNEELRKLFNENGCLAGSRAKADTVVYNQFGTKSRVLQQKRAYQLLLTNGHAKVKEAIVDSDNDDTARFIEFYGKLSDTEKAAVIGFDSIQTTKLSDSEMPRERSVKLASTELLVKFLKYMAGFEENKMVVAE